LLISKKNRNFAVGISKTNKMTQIVLQNSIDTMQMSVLRGLFNSWNVAVEIKEEKKPEVKTSSQRFARTIGMWKDYEIDAKQLRRDAWGTEKLPQR
jgi:hypothetical protein